MIFHFQILFILSLNNFLDNHKIKKEKMKKTKKRRQKEKMKRRRRQKEKKTKREDKKEKMNTPEKARKVNTHFCLAKFKFKPSLNLNLSHTLQSIAL